MKQVMAIVMLACACRVVLAADDPPSPGGYGVTGFPKPYSAPCVERENVFEFTEKPAVKNLGNDKYEITFAVKGNCDVTAGVIDPSTSSGQGEKGIVVRHLGSGVLGANAPEPFQKNSLKQTIYWNGKDDLAAYVKEPGKMRVRVMLGLKPEFDKRLGGTSPKNFPSDVWGIAADESGVFVFLFVRRHFYLRKFDHDGNYLMSMVPPPANLPESKLEGMGYVEYEAGQRGIQFPGDVNETCENEGNFLPVAGKEALPCRPVVVGGRLFYASVAKGEPPRWHLNYVYGDGSTSLNGCRPREMFPLMRPPWESPAMATEVSLAASPDGRQLYFVSYGYRSKPYAVWRCELDGDKPAALFIGGKEPSSAEGKFSGTMDMDCDAEGRLYVCDSLNNRVQIFSPEGKFLKSISAGGPKSVTVHRKTGAVYLLHTARVEGKSTNRVTKFVSLDDPTPVAHVDVSVGGMAMDSWAPKPRIWLWGGGTVLSIWEEDGKTFKKISDFAEEAKKEDGPNQIGWSGGISDKVVCDPLREQVYIRNSIRFDLKTGALLGSVRLGADDIAFDKRGYVHLHFNPSHRPGVGRLDPSRQGSGPGVSYPECPYDYGEEGSGGWIGIIKTRDQLGAKFFQDGVGVNIRGDVAEECNIYYVPKMEKEGLSFAMAGHGGNANVANSSEVIGEHVRAIKDAEKRGEEVYWIRPKPGVPLMGATIWTFDRNGELRDECAVLEGSLINGVMMDEDGAVYFVCARTRLFDGKPFLAGRRGNFGAGKGVKMIHPLTGVWGATAPEPSNGTLIKVRKKATILSTSAPIHMDERPARPPELQTPTSTPYPENAWCEGAEWMYAGASPIVFGDCSCPTMRHHTDWYKRTFVPEAYRHSIGVLDANGNLVLHIGRYGNFDSGDGPKSKIPVGGDGIAITFNRFVSSTDNYLVFDNHGEQLVVLKLNYHAEETVGIQ